MSGPEKIDGLGAVVDRFDCFLVDQFGVLRDGRGPYPGAAETLSRLKAAGKRVIVLSNSGKRAAENSRRLAGIGFDAASWDLFLTSGETAWRILKAEMADGIERRCLLISRDGDTSAIVSIKSSASAKRFTSGFVLSESVKAMGQVLAPTREIAGG